MQITPEPHVPLGGVKLSDISVLDRARLACNTMAALYPGDTTPPTDEDIDLARDTFTKVTHPQTPSLPAVALYSNASLRYLDTMLSEYDHELVNSAVRVREFVKNKLLVESENPDGKIRIRALELLGKMKDVGLFTDRLEITHKTKSDEELEAELSKKIERYMGAAVIESEDSLAEAPEPAPPPPPRDMSSFIDSLAP